jgi:hypothetical protein
MLLKMTLRKKCNIKLSEYPLCPIKECNFKFLYGLVDE